MRFPGLFNSTEATKYLKFTYMATITLLLSAIVLTPVFIRGHLLLLKKYVIEEDVVEAVFIIILLLIAYIVSNIYKKELKKYREQTRRLMRDNCDLSSKLDDAFKYIGGVNVQIEQIRSIFCGLRRYPATEKAFKRDLTLFARKILEIVNADWVMIRIISQDNLRTIKDHLESRKNVNFKCKGISNKAIVANRPIEGYSIVTSSHYNSVIMGVCVFPKKSLTGEEEILVEATTNQIEMLYLIYISHQSLEIYPPTGPLHEVEKNIAK
jgi:hypothetical protein